MNKQENPEHPILLTVEGLDCSGKTTNIISAVDLLRQHHVPFVHSREPGGTKLAEDLRSIILTHSAEHDLDPLVEVMLFHCARIDHCQRLIRPSIAAGKHVLLDRYYDSTVAYQGALNNMSMDYLIGLQNTALHHGHIVRPTKTLLFDISVDTFIERKRARGLVKGEEINGIEDRDRVYYQRVADNFLYLAEHDPERFIIIDANRDLTNVVNDTLSAVRGVFNL